MDENIHEQTQQNEEKKDTQKLKTWGDIRNDILAKLKKESNN